MVSESDDQNLSVDPRVDSGEGGGQRERMGEICSTLLHRKQRCRLLKKGGSKKVCAMDFASWAGVPVRLCVAERNQKGNRRLSC